MLRASSALVGPPARLRGILDLRVDSGVAAASELLAFADAAVLADPHEMALARARLLAAIGEPGTVRAAACAGNFQMMNRLLDAIGAPIGAAGRHLAAELGVSVPEHLLG